MCGSSSDSPWTFSLQQYDNWTQHTRGHSSSGCGQDYTRENQQQSGLNMVMWCSVIWDKGRYMLPDKDRVDGWTALIAGCAASKMTVLLYLLHICFQHQYQSAPE